MNNQLVAADLLRKAANVLSSGNASPVAATTPLQSSAPPPTSTCTTAVVRGPTTPVANTQHESVAEHVRSIFSPYPSYTNRGGGGGGPRYHRRGRGRGQVEQISWSHRFLALSSTNQVFLFFPFRGYFMPPAMAEEYLEIKKCRCV